MSDLSVAVQKAIYVALAAALNPTKVYDGAPQGAAYPYVVMDSTAITPMDALSKRRDERYFYLSVWSEYRGQKEILEIMSAIDAALHLKRLSMDEGAMVICYVEGKNTQREPDNLTFHGSVKLRIVTQR